VLTTVDSAILAHTRICLFLGWENIKVSGKVKQYYLERLTILKPLKRFNGKVGVKIPKPKV